MVSLRNQTINLPGVLGSILGWVASVYIDACVDDDDDVDVHMGSVAQKTDVATNKERANERTSEISKKHTHSEMSL